ncbi:hypothetical protein O181_054347 [Austropuccinia psidii MF-1]|uniref:Tc1-like transposase DDE domain-containing protein n=1 Tax=Austropuccinia psidii MF-1 TaxID=1389203 RepID=A0A9Q3HSF8_9BASI|nr:hypothetical protein [Austropuccinia psidii MF-1]
MLHTSQSKLEKKHPCICSLVQENVVEKGMSQKAAAEAFKISSCQVYLILHETPNQTKTYKKGEGKITAEMTTELLYFIDNRSTVTSKEMKEFLDDKFPIKISFQSISNLPHDMDITWKQVTNIPASWKKENLLAQRANFVNCHGLDLDRQVVFVDKTGFDLHSGRGFGYSPSGQPAVLSLVPRVKQITLIAAILASGFVYHEILNANGQMTKSVGNDEFELFLLALQFKIPNNSILIMDNAPIHQG